MTASQSNSRPAFWTAIIFILLIATTLSLFFGFAHRPYSDNSIVAVCYYCLLELVLGTVLIVGPGTRRKVDTTALSIQSGILFIYSLIGTITVLLNLLQPAEKQLTGTQFGLLLAAEGVLFLIIAIFVAQRDRTQSLQDATREEEDESNDLPTLAKAIAALTAAQVQDVGLIARVDSLTKEIEKLRSTLKFSPPGSRSCPQAARIAQLSASPLDESMLKELGTLVAQASSTATLS